MFTCEGELFEIKDNELQFLETCEKLKNHPFESPWKHCFSTTEEALSNFSCEVHELNNPEINKFNSSSNEYAEISMHPKETLRESNSEEFKVPELCTSLQTVLSEEAIKVFHIKQNSSRNLLAVVLKFSEIYPKPVIDEIVVPCLNQSSLETLQLETLLKMVKTNLPSEYVGYCIKSILECAMQVDSTFSILQNLIERKIHHEHTLLEFLTQKIESWSLVSKKNVKFTKLLISILITYGSELNQQQVTTYDDVIKINETLMKKAAENVIKQLKTQ